MRARSERRWTWREERGGGGDGGVAAASDAEWMGASAATWMAASAVAVDDCTASDTDGAASDAIDAESVTIVDALSVSAPVSLASPGIILSTASVSTFLEALSFAPLTSGSATLSVSNASPCTEFLATSTTRPEEHGDANMVFKQLISEETLEGAMRHEPDKSPARAAPTRAGDATRHTHQAREGNMSSFSWSAR